MDPNTTHDREARLASAARAVVPCLTVLWHADVARVGERALLVDAAFGGSVALGRAAPLFGPRGAAALHPLGDRSVSRAPLHLRGTPDGGLALAIDGDHHPARVDGAPIASPRHLTGAELDAGVVLTLSSRVAVLLHRAAPGGSAPNDFGLVGVGDGIERVRTAIARAAPEDIPVLLVGETGTGKELAARALHVHGTRRDGPFVAVNMAAIPQGTATATLFGHRRGAFTGAVTSGQGLFEAADGGTLFLDEVGDTPPEIQGMLLRTLETQELRPVGGPLREVDVRVVAAAEDVGGQGASALRSALLHRLAGLTIHLPPLRDRPEDLGVLLRHFVTRALAETAMGARVGTRDLGAWITADLVARLAAHSWPGNVRELSQLATRLVVTSWESPVARLDGHLDALATARPAVTRELERPAPPAPPARTRAAADLTVADLLDALERCEWRPTAAARVLGISKTTLYQRLNAHGVTKAADLDATAVRRALEAEGAVDRAARALRVSQRGLVLRMRQLGLDPPP